MGWGPGGKKRIEIHKDHGDPDVYDQEQKSQCFIHVVNSLTWRSITGKNPPTEPYTEEDYAENEYPWFKHYGYDSKALGAKYN